MVTTALSPAEITWPTQQWWPTAPRDRRPSDPPARGPGQAARALVSWQPRSRRRTTTQTPARARRTSARGTAERGCVGRNAADCSSSATGRSPEAGRWAAAWRRSHSADVSSCRTEQSSASPSCTRLSPPGSWQAARGHSSAGTSTSSGSTFHLHAADKNTNYAVRIFELSNRIVTSVFDSKRAQLL